MLFLNKQLLPILHQRSRPPNQISLVDSLSVGVSKPHYEPSADRGQSVDDVCLCMHIYPSPSESLSTSGTDNKLPVGTSAASRGKSGVRFTKEQFEREVTHLSKKKQQSVEEERKRRLVALAFLQFIELHCYSL